MRSEKVATLSTCCACFLLFFACPAMAGGSETSSVSIVTGEGQLALNIEERLHNMLPGNPIGELRDQPGLMSRSWKNDCSMTTGSGTGGYEYGPDGWYFGYRVEEIPEVVDRSSLVVNDVPGSTLHGTKFVTFCEGKSNTYSVTIWFYGSKSLVKRSRGKVIGEAGVTLAAIIAALVSNEG